MAFSSDFVHSLELGTDKFTKMGAESIPEYYKQVFDIEKSNKLTETIVTQAGTGLLAIRPEGANYTMDSFHEGFEKQFTAVEYAGGYTISRIAVADNLYPQLVKSRSRMLGESYMTTKNAVCLDVLNNSFTTELAADGVAICSASHKMEKGGTYRNILSVASALSEASLEQMCIDIREQLKAGNAFNLHATPEKLIVPVALDFEAARILKSVQQNDTANNAVNALRVMGSIPKGYCAIPDLDSATAYWVKTSVSDGLVVKEREPMTIEMDTQFSSDMILAKIRGRWSQGCVRAQALFGSAGTA